MIWHNLAAGPTEDEKEKKRGGRGWRPKGALVLLTRAEVSTNEQRGLFSFAITLQESLSSALLETRSNPNTIEEAFRSAGLCPHTTAVLRPLKGE